VNQAVYLRRVYGTGIASVVLLRKKTTVVLSSHTFGQHTKQLASFLSRNRGKNKSSTMAEVEEEPPTTVTQEEQPKLSIPAMVVKVSSAG
jgi:hypothetical protein